MTEYKTMRVPVEDWQEAREAKAEKETWGEYLQRCADEPILRMTEEDIIRIVDDRIQDLVVEEAIAR